MSPKIKNGLRWVAVLPGALLASIATQMICGFAMGMVDSFFTFIDTPIFNLVITTGVGACFFVVTGTWIAPSAKPITARILAVLACLLGIGAIIFYASFPSEPGTLGLILQAVGYVLGAFIGWANSEE